MSKSVVSYRNNNNILIIWQNLVFDKWLKNMRLDWVHNSDKLLYDNDMLH